MTPPPQTRRKQKPALAEPVVPEAEPEFEELAGLPEAVSDSEAAEGEATDAECADTDREVRAGLAATFESVASPEKPTPVQKGKPSSSQTVTPPVQKGKPSPSTAVTPPVQKGRPSPSTTAVTPPVQKGNPSPSTTAVTPPVHHGGKPSPKTGDKAAQPTARRTMPNPMEQRLAAMQKQLEEQASLIAGFREAEEEPVDPMQEKIRVLEEQLQKQAELIKQRKAGSPAPNVGKAAVPDEQSDEALNAGSLDTDSIVMPDGTRVISHDALRMRLKRLCERKKTGKAWVSDELITDYKSGGSSREQLEIALLETIKQLGPDAAHQKMRAAFTSRVTLVKERILQREKEVTGEWLTEERMKNKHNWGKDMIKQVTQYCLKFPATLTRPWKYNASVTEYFVELESTSKIKQSELDKYLSETTQVKVVSLMTASDMVMVMAVWMEGTAEQPLELASGVASGFTGDPILENSRETPVVNAEHQKVKDELKRYLDALLVKSRTVSRMIEQLNEPYNPKPTEGTVKLADELSCISAPISAAYEKMAGLVSKLEMENVDAAGIQRVKVEFTNIRETVAKPWPDCMTMCAELLAKDAQHKLVMKNVNLARKKEKAEAEQDDNEPEKVPAVTKDFGSEACNTLRCLRHLRLDVPISTVAVDGDSEYPVLKAVDFVKCMDRYGFWDKLFGTPSLAKGEQMCYDYWCKYRKLYPNFDLFRRNLPLNRCVPVYLHGDEGQHFKKAAIMIVQWQSAIGRGQRDFDFEDMSEWPAYLDTLDEQLPWEPGVHTSAEAQASATRAINMFMKGLYTGGLWLSGNDLELMVQSGMHFLRASSRLSLLSFHLGEERFAITPKNHSLYHIVKLIQWEADMIGFARNPCCESCSQDEDLVGRIARVSRSVSPRTTAMRTLQRYLLLAHEAWYRES
ncbi:unnamed protein product [Symbiodinium microadriaticum]|nr:unnamed protein product [Symbiodinium microadriaticum]